MSPNTRISRDALALSYAKAGILGGKIGAVSGKIYKIQERKRK